MRPPSLFRTAAFSLAFLSASAAYGRQVVFSEIMYQPAGTKPEFVEVWNMSMTPLDMAKWRFSAGVTFQFPDFDPAAVQAHFLGPLERIIVSAVDEAATRFAYPGIPATVRVFGPWQGQLADGAERLTLEDKNGVRVCSVRYEDGGRWPMGADGTGHSIVLVNENREVDDWHNWRRSNLTGGSPGLAETPAAQSLSISEVHFDDLGRVDWVEMRNSGPSATALDGLFLASRTDLADRIALSGSIAGLGFASKDVLFAPDGDGDITVLLVDTSNNVVSAIDLRRQAGRPSSQEFPAGAGLFFSSTSSTRDVANAPDRRTEIVINEIMFDPPSNQRDGEYVELFNRGTAAVNLSGWRLETAVEFTFPPGTTLPPGGYVVVAANSASLNASYAGLNALGNWDGQLSNDGESLRLLDQFGNLADEVDYKAGGDWPEAANGNGSSMELVHPDADNSVAGAWRDSDESSKSTFQPFAINGGIYRRTARGGVTDDEVRLWTVSDAHLILRNIVMRPAAGGANLLVNAETVTSANNNTSGWLCRGTHAASFSDAQGVHIVADGHGDNKANHAEKSTVGMLANTSYTLEFEARWVSGKGRLIAQTWDVYGSSPAVPSWGGTVAIPVPSNLGTPGAVNSRFLPAPPPQIVTAVHSPAVPQPNQPVTITARLVSAAPLASVQVFHRADDIASANAWTPSPMNDSGTGGDAAAGDGIWSAQITSYPADRQVAQFYVRATADNGQIAEYPKAGAAAPGLWIVDSRVVADTLRRIRIVISTYWLDALNQNSATGGHTAKFNFKYPRLSNRYFPCTFISNESEVYYNTTVRKTGSPWTRQTDANLTRGIVNIPGDRAFRGQEKLYWDNDSGVNLRHNRITRYWLYLLGVPGNENEFVRVTRNGDAPTVRETSEFFDKRMLERIFDNGNDGYFYEMDDTFFIDDAGANQIGGTNINGDWRFRGENPTTYQNSFVPKSREDEYDFSGLMEWTRQLTTTPQVITPEQLERMADTQAMAAYAAVRGYISDWDNITLERGKNGYFYQRPDGKIMLLHWDSDLAFRAEDYSDALIGGLPQIPTYFNKPFVRHYLHYYVTEMMANYTLNSPRINAWIAAENSATPSNLVNSVYTSWFTNRNPRLTTALASSNLAPFALTAPPPATTENTANLDGTAPSTAFRVEAIGHPEAVLTWTAVTTFTLNDIQLRSGANLLTLRMFDRFGIQIGTDITHTVTKEGDAPPVATVVSTSGSLNVALGEPIILEAGSSFDPEGQAISYAWSVSPTGGATISNPTPSSVRAIFTAPGIYTFTLQVTDLANQTTTVTRQVTAFNVADFEGFDSPLLAPNLVAQNIEARDNYSPAGWYSLADEPGTLRVQVLSDAPKPLNGALGHPFVSRILPVTADWALQTEFGLLSRQFGSFHAGLLIELSEGGQTVRYVLSLDGGLNVTVRRGIGPADYPDPLKTLASTGSGATLRVRRAGATLFFERAIADVWTEVHTVALPPDATALRGGVFVATSTAQSVAVEFDYLLLSDPGNSTNLVDHLRITEVMYNSSAVGGVEFIELTNTGNSPLELQGAYFEDSRPFDQFVFQAMTLQPRAFVVVTNDIAAFRNLYGNGATIAGQFTGALNNNGERIVLKDAQGNTIQDFIYGTNALWPAKANGGGSSLEILLTTGNYSDPANWREGVELNGSPGVLGVGYDGDGDGQPDRAEVVVGTNPSDPNSIFRVTQVSVNASGHVTITWPSAPGISYQVEFQSEAAANGWQFLNTVPGGGSTTSFTDTSAAGQPNRFYRVTVP